MTTAQALDQNAIDDAVAALRCALAAARAHAAGTDLADQVGRLAEAKLVISAAGRQVLIELFAPSTEGDTLRLFALEAHQEVMQ